jgi:DNA-binding transcriptional LysR family regulator
MHGVHLSAIDVNLLVALRALLETGNVTLAARRLGLSPSATSHALARLRSLLGDPLLVRAGRKLVLTPRATALAEPLGRALEALETALLPQEALDPRSLERAFRVETTDHVQFVLLRALDARARARSPGVDIYLQSLQRETFARLREGAIDLAISVYDEVDADLEKETLFDDRLVTVVRRGHPALRRRMTLARFAALDHLLVAPNGSPTGLVDRLLAEHGLRRRVARTSSTFLDIAFLVAETDYVVSLPETVARPLVDELGLAIVRLPLQLPSFTHSMIWHRRTTNEPAHAWFRALVAEAVSDIRATARGKILKRT